MIDVSQFYSLKMGFFFFFWCFHSHSIGEDFGFFRNLGVHFNGPDFLGGRFMDGPGKGEKWTR